MALWREPGLSRTRNHHVPHRTLRAESVLFSMTHHLGLTAVAPDPVTGTVLYIIDYRTLRVP